jgi:hypothetical protein
MSEEVVRQFVLERVRIVSGESKFGRISGTTKSSLSTIFKKWCKGKKIYWSEADDKERDKELARSLTKHTWLLFQHVDRIDPEERWGSLGISHDKFRGLVALNDEHVFSIGSRVRTERWSTSEGGNHWVHGTVKAVKPDGRVDIVYDDGDSESDVLENNARLIVCTEGRTDAGTFQIYNRLVNGQVGFPCASTTILQSGQRDIFTAGVTGIFTAGVTAQVRKKFGKKWYSGMIKDCWTWENNELFHIEYEDGDKEDVDLDGLLNILVKSSAGSCRSLGSAALTSQHVCSQRPKQNPHLQVASCTHFADTSITCPQIPCETAATTAPDAGVSGCVLL